MPTYPSEMIMDGVNSDQDPRSDRTLSLPVLSFILPVYNAGGYLAQCLDRITQQTFRDIEIIAIDGASTDDSAAILEERERTEPRLTVIRDSARIGPGNARNMGAKVARGEYLWFVDADDTVTTGCLTSIVHSLGVAGPDVLLVGYELIYPSGRVKGGPVASLNDRVSATCFTVAEHPEALDVSLASWNKIVRKTFFDSLGVAFSSEWPHEDVVVSCRLMLNASKLSILDQTCYRYRKDRPGSSMASGDPKRHFMVFKAWKTVLEQARTLAEARHPQVSDEVYRALFERAIWHCSTQLDTGGWAIGVLGADGYIARRDRREFFDCLTTYFEEFVPHDYVRPPGFRGLKFDLIRHGDYRLYSMFDLINKVKNAARPPATLR